MLDAATAELIKAGLGYVLFLFACGVIGVMWRKIDALQTENRTAYTEYNTEIQGIFEKRLAESREIVLAMERSTAMSVERNAAIQSQSSAIGDLTKGFAALVLTSENSRTRFVEVGQRLEERQGEALKMLTTLVSSRGQRQDP